eukprot:SAG31_NODE_302_length_18087_cov_97.056982_6_plen_239_part_00
MAAVGETNAGPKATIKRICNISSHVAAAESVAPPVNSTMPKERVYQLRKKHFCAAQSISYENTNPLLIVRGNGQYLFDEAGNQYLDTRNNVGHVGHSNKRVANAVAAQALALNTNTRYLHQNISLLAEKLAATLPDPLEICFFVNSGSEANDLAIRLARAHTGHENFVVVDRVSYSSFVRSFVRSLEHQVTLRLLFCLLPSLRTEFRHITDTHPQLLIYHRTNTSIRAARVASLGSSK